MSADTPDCEMKDSKPPALPTAPTNLSHDPSTLSSVPGELPFLVTNWLTTFSANKKATQPQIAALQSIQTAAADLAAAFATLGAFGTATTTQQPRTFADMKRSWDCPPEHLQQLLTAASSSSRTLHTVAHLEKPHNYLQQTQQKLQVIKRTNTTQGTNSDDAINLDDAQTTTSSDSDQETNTNRLALVAPGTSVLQPPVLSWPSDKPSSPLGSPVEVQLTKSAESMRNFLDLRSQYHKDVAQIRAMEHSLQFHTNKLEQLQSHRKTLLESSKPQSKTETDALMAQLETIQQEDANSVRAVEHLQRQLPILQRAKVQAFRRLRQLQQEALSAFGLVRHSQRQFRDPLRPTSLRHRVLRNLGTPRRTNQDTRKALLQSRLSHAATINTHLSYPVYCIKFDKSGRYFISGADDYLVKVFCTNVRVPPGQSHIDPISYIRGAVLVCTLKGHAGVINDIEVSSDNCFLATASEDGDCRVWGLKDGCPIAILRGHGGGANMVSWSLRTPYRLVTAGADGLARTWDIREACLKRYGKFVRQRPEYQLLQPGKESSTGNRDQPEMHDGDSADMQVGENPDAAMGENLPRDQPLLEPAIAVPMGDNPPVDPAVPPEPVAEGDEMGRFVANDRVDEGVEIISKLQHGATAEERLEGQGTRARRAAVKVICIARSPNGGHFATGSDDGNCHIWREESSDVEAIDLRELGDVAVETVQVVVDNSNSSGSSADALLHTLKGHVHAITDLNYSNKGDRILTASQKDGAVRVWSWTKDPAAVVNDSDHSHSRQARVSHILIKLTRPTEDTSVNTRGRIGRGQNPAITCDVACWTCDDTKIITSQGELAKNTGTDIIAGSQHLFLWESSTGHCLLGIPAAHSKFCPVVLPHPFLPSIMCSAGADGIVQLWDWETGDSFFTHRNVADFGPIDANERGKNLGYLDGEFSPDGTAIALTDDGGRITMFDCTSPANSGNGTRLIPEWMKEQYFSNDYYDLYYDVNGYCIERGSEQPPHLAPKGTRCTHSGSAFPLSIKETFRSLIGPIPSCEASCRWARFEARKDARRELNRVRPYAGNRIQQYDPQLSVLLGEKVAAPSATATASAAAGRPNNEPEVSTNGRQLSSNWRWRDYNDAVRELGEEEGFDFETDDEDFQIENRAASNAVDGADSDSDNLDQFDDDQDDETLTSPVQNRPIRPSRLDADSSDEDIEIVSTNNHPYGPFIADYDDYFFRIMSRERANRISRSWLRRNESNSSYEGRKGYTPQIGDEVVYIPRAHLDLIEQFPNLTPPWQSWPDSLNWPIVQCSVKSIRYRLPFKSGRGRCRSIVAILTLEVTGLPESVDDRNFDWPVPSFVVPPQEYLFDLSLFEYDMADDFIVPLQLYVTRVSLLEEALNRGERETKCFVHYAPEEGDDVEYLSYTGSVAVDTRNRVPQLNHPSLTGSGYKSLRVTWDTSTGGDSVSPWEVTIMSDHPTAIGRPRLNDDEKKRVREALSAIRVLDGVDEAFHLPVNLATYSDYLTRVELPMDISFVSNRLDADYYSTLMSVVSDVALICINCIKYNGQNDDLSALARRMLDAFEADLLSESERAMFHKFDSPVAGRHTVDVESQPDNPTDLQEQHSVPNSGSPVAIRRSTRVRLPRSVFEELPSPASEGSRPTPAQHRTRAAQRRRSARAHRRAEGPNALRASNRQVRTLEQLSSRTGMSTRGRTRRAVEGEPVHFSARPGLRNSRAVDSNPAPDPPMNNGRSRRNARLQATRRANARRRNIVRELMDLQDDDDSPEERLPPLEEESESEPEEPQLETDESESERPVAPRVRGTRRSTRSSTSALEDSDNDSTSGQAPTRSSSRRIESRTNIDIRAADDESDEHHVEDDGLGQTSDEAPVTSQSATRRRSPKRGALSSDEDEPASPRTRRNTRAVTKKASYAEDSSDDENEDPEPVTGSGSRASSRRVRIALKDGPSNSSAKATGRRGKRRRIIESDSEADDAEEYDQKPAAVESSPDDDFDESDDDVELEESSEEEEDSAMETKSPRHRQLRNGSRSRPATAPLSTARTTTRKRQRGKKPVRSASSSGRHLEAPKSYADPSSSDFGSDVSVDDGMPKRGKKQKVTRRASLVDRKSIIRKTKTQYMVGQWPDIHPSKIFNVTKEVLNRLREMDTDRIFWIPAVEAYPEIADSYNRIVAFPMDFRTIDLERLDAYESIAELQDDLILVFRNCMDFNEPETDFHNIARSLLDQLDEIFRGVCDDLQVRMKRPR